MRHEGDEGATRRGEGKRKKEGREGETRSVSVSKRKTR